MFQKIVFLFCSTEYKTSDTSDFDNDIIVEKDYGDFKGKTLQLIVLSILLKFLQSFPHRFYNKCS